MFPRKNSPRQLSSDSPQTPALAADSEILTEEVDLVSEQDQELSARLSYDFPSGALKLVFLQPVPFGEFDAEIQFTDGTHIPVERVVINDGEAVLLASTERTEETVAQVQLLPL
jgi:hypothetical protein